MEPSPVIRNKHRVAVDTDVILQHRTNEAVSPGVLSNSNKLEEDESFQDSQFVVQVQINSVKRPF